MHTDVSILLWELFFASTGAGLFCVPWGDHLAWTAHLEDTKMLEREHHWHPSHSVNKINISKCAVYNHDLLFPHIINIKSVHTIFRDSESLWKLYSFEFCLTGLCCTESPLALQQWRINIIQFINFYVSISSTISHLNMNMIELPSHICLHSRPSHQHLSGSRNVLFPAGNPISPHIPHHYRSQHGKISIKNCFYLQNQNCKFCDSTISVQSTIII